MTFKKGNKCSSLRKPENRKPTLGHKHTEESKQKMRLKALGHKRNLGHRHSRESILKMSLVKLGDKHPLWKGYKGDNLAYQNLHNYMRRHLPKPNSCSICHENRDLDLANITGEYNRFFDNWLYLCKSCHFKWDGIVDNFKILSHMS